MPTRFLGRSRRQPAAGARWCRAHHLHGRRSQGRWLPLLCLADQKQRAVPSQTSVLWLLVRESLHAATGRVPDRRSGCPRRGVRTSRGQGRCQARPRHPGRGARSGSLDANIRPPEAHASIRAASTPSSPSPIASLRPLVVICPTYTVEPRVNGLYSRRMPYEVSRSAWQQTRHSPISGPAAHEPLFVERSRLRRRFHQRGSLRRGEQPSRRDCSQVATKQVQRE